MFIKFFTRFLQIFCILNIWILSVPIIVIHFLFLFAWLLLKCQHEKGISLDRLLFNIFLLILLGLRSTEWLSFHSTFRPMPCTFEINFRVFRGSRLFSITTHTSCTFLCHFNQPNYIIFLKGLYVIFDFYNLWFFVWTLIRKHYSKIIYHPQWRLSFFIWNHFLYCFDSKRVPYFGVDQRNDLMYWSFGRMHQNGLL